MRLIDGDKLMEELPKEYLGSTVHDLINSAPTIEIIRCGECKRANYEWSGIRCGLSDALMGEDGFCSIGERSDDE